MQFTNVATLVVLSCLLSAASSTDAFRLPGFASRPVHDGPKFCHDLECPKFETESALNSDTELRSYTKASWVSTKVDGPSLDLAMSIGFMRLFKYIQGNNADNATMDMTAPVRLVVDQEQLYTPSDSNSFTVSFFLSNNFSSKNPAPAPSCKHVFLESEPATDYFVKTYGGWSTELSVRQKSTELMQELDDLGMAYDNTTVLFAGYDSPFRLLWRHNEVWVKAKSMYAKVVA